MSGPQRFLLRRLEDESGVSGTGVVAEGVVFSDGTAAMRWRTGTASTAVYASIEDVRAIHGHGGKTIVELERDFDLIELEHMRLVAAGADVCLAFPLGRSAGTRNCMAAAERAGIRVVEHSPQVAQ